VFKENDNISHFICRLAYCRNEELRRWFVTQETRLFSLRLSELNPLTVKQLLESKLGIVYETVKAQDPIWQKYENDITFKYGQSSPSDFVKVPFKEAISLVSRRAVFLYQGIAYVPVRELQ
jgi:DNA primase large subunit